MTTSLSTFSESDFKDLQRAHEILENPSIAAKLANLVGSPIEQSMNILPTDWYERIHQVTALSIEKALRVAVDSLPNKRARNLPHRFYTSTAMGVGAIGGFMGLPALAIELPLSTTLLLRAIADVAQQEGEELNDMDSRMACMEVFALGGISSEDDAAETGYYGARIALAMTFSHASQYIAAHGLSHHGAPALVSLMSAVTTRFGAAVSQKTALQVLPVAGAIGGAAINGLFMGHFKSMAHGHFTLRRLERKYGETHVRSEYERLNFH